MANFTHLWDHGYTPLINNGPGSLMIHLPMCFILLKTTNGFVTLRWWSPHLADAFAVIAPGNLFFSSQKLSMNHLE